MKIVPTVYAISNQIINTISYASGMINSLRKKTFTGMAILRGVSHDRVRRELLQATKEIPEVRVALKQDVQREVNKVAGGGAIVMDTTAAVKEYAKQIEGLAFEHTGSSREQGIKLALFGWTDMHTRFLPLDLLVPKAIPKFEFKNLIERAIVLAQQLNVSTILADAIFASIYGFSLLEDTKKYGVMRFHCNRVVNIEGYGKYQLRDHPAFKFSRNSRCVVREITWHGLKLCVIALKLPHKTKKWRTIFLVTNAPINRALEYAEYYKHRWKIEPVFRTSKQSHGLKDCQARSIKMQEAHFLASFVAYRVLSADKPGKTTKSKKRKKYVEILRKKINLTLTRKRPSRMGHAVA